MKRGRQPGYLDGQFLVAMPGMEDERFRRGVVYVCAHSDEGAMGILVNQPMRALSFRDLLVQLKVVPAEDDAGAGARDILLVQGGPVETGRGFVLHSPDFQSVESTLAIDTDVCLTATLDVLRALASGAGPERATMALGYAGWGQGQLEREIRDNGWLICPGDPSLIYDHDLGGKYERALRRIGVDPASLSSAAGRA
jgi:putative transcriptional regulator